jgi:hypothetical protein
MDFIIEQIKTIREENNTAQESFSTFLNRIPTSSTEIILSNEDWSGDLDFAILKQRGFHNITSIEIQKASITKVNNLPLNLTRFACSYNLLISLEKLPSTLQILEVPHNYLQRIDIQGLSHLRKVVVSNNQLKELSPLMESLEQLDCEHNDLASLDLFPCKQLIRLHCSHNPILVLKDPPVSLIDLQMDNNPLTEIQRKYKEDVGAGKDNTDENDAKIEYIEAIQTYFKIKAQYEEKELALKRTAYEKGSNKRDKRNRASAVKPPCIYCKRKVGTIFKCKDRKYTAICGDVREPCPLNIQIFGGYYENLTQILYSFKVYLEEIKETIIQQKMNTLFQYLNENKSAEKFKKNMEEYHSTNVMFKEIMETYQDLYDSPYKREQIKRKEIEIYELMQRIRDLLVEYQKSTSLGEMEERAARNIMETILDSHSTLENQIHSLRMLKYATVEMDELKTNEGKISILKKWDVALPQIDYLAGDEPSVIKFIAKPK